MKLSVSIIDDDKRIKSSSSLECPVKKEGINIPVLFGYGPNAVHGQSVITSFYGQGSILKKLECNESVIPQLVSNEFSDLFSIQSGNDFKLPLETSISDWLTILDRMPHTLKELLN